ncbi:MAG TPA: DNA-3-methyladenine glycosylase, partial [Candidatus Limnocylindrales bacterium]|nr:DNA-3-methyladenine glycosylase [Candidatus Limnocylindrales bacterium]
LGPDDAARIEARLARTPVERLAAGPGLAGAAFGIDRGLTGSDLLDPDRPIHLEAAASDEPAFEIQASPRIGIAFAGPPWVGEPWRFAIAGNRSVSR